jgi:hypothetical protein
MPYGMHIATCLHCLKQWVVGDCIPSICPECVDKGHHWNLPFFDCPKCREECELLRKWARERAEAASDREPMPAPAHVELDADEEFSKGIL